MRVLAIGPRSYLGDIYLSLTREGHEVRVFAEDAVEDRAFGGILDWVPDWRAELPWVGREGLVFFERIGRGAVQDALRAEGYRVVGGSAYGDRLEEDRAFGQGVLRDAGLSVARSWSFGGPADAAAWLAEHPGRYVLKHDAVGRTTFVGDHPRGADVAFVLGRARAADPNGRLMLMERLEGVEVGVGAYFDGTAFLEPACLDFEHKRFFDGDRGEMTGEMGTLATYDGADRLMAATLARVAGPLRAAGHVGYVNLNLIVNKAGVWPLEFTSRIGNPGFAVLAALQPDGWGDLFGRMADGGRGTFRTTQGWGVCVVVTVPPFPASDERSRPEEDPPVFFLDAPAGEEVARYHLMDARRDGDGTLLARRRSGYVMIVTGVGETVEAAQAAAYCRAANVVVPEGRWRTDIGDRFLREDRARLRALGWLP